MSVPAATVVGVRVVGYLDTPLVPYTMQKTDELTARGVKPTVFNDWWEMTGYDSEARIRLTEWTRSNLALGKTWPSHVLMRSKIVAMGVTVANMALGGALVVHSDRAVFDAELRAAARRSASPARA